MKTLFKASSSILLAIIATVGIFSLYLLSLGPDVQVRPTRQMSEVWKNYPFKSHYVEVNGNKMHFIDEGKPNGPVVLFLHGNPTSSYLWRSVVPIVAASGARAIAVDNIGFGASDRPDIDYRFSEHAEYLDGFISALGLQDITLVVHDWGSGLGFDYAYRNPTNVSAVVFMEAILASGSIDDLEGDAKTIFSAFRTPVIGEFLVMAQNVFIESGLQASVVRELTEEELDAYREPFPTWASRLPVLVWPREIPFDGSPADTAMRVNAYAAWLPTSSIPKLMLYGEPGAILNRERANEMTQKWQNLDAEFMGDGLHFIQEDQGPIIGRSIVEWLNKSQRDVKPSVLGENT